MRIILFNKNDNLCPSDNIVTERTQVPEIWYIDSSGRCRRYYVDIYIKNRNKVIEVKSMYTYNIGKYNIYSKLRTAKMLGYEAELWIIEKDTIFLKEVI